MSRLRITIDGISTEEIAVFLGRLASIALGLALTIELDGEVMTKTAAMKAAKVMPERAKMGRKPKGRTPITVHLEPGALVALESTAKRLGLSRSDAMNEILNRAVATGLLTSMT